MLLSAKLSNEQRSWLAGDGWWWHLAAARHVHDHVAVASRRVMNDVDLKDSRRRRRRRPVVVNDRLLTTSICAFPR